MQSIFVKILSQRYYLALAFFIFVFACKNKKSTDKKKVFSSLEKIEAQYQQDLKLLIKEVEKWQECKDIESIQNKYESVRLSFKKTEPIILFYYSKLFHRLNDANLPKFEEGDNGASVIGASGLQTIEESMYDQNIDLMDIKAQIKGVHNLLLKTSQRKSFESKSKYHFLWMLQKEIVYVLTKGITGFDSPVLAASLPENKSVFESLKSYISLTKEEFKSEELYNDWIRTLDLSIELLSYNDFETFDRYQFIQESLHPILTLIDKTAKDWKVEYPFNKPINYEASSFFSPQTFNIDYFATRNSGEITKEKTSLGKKLFFDKRLSKDKKMACASCHQPEKYFTDGKEKAVGNNGNELLRNTPTLYYAALQANQFYDGRVANLENQISSVVKNKDEFHTDLSILKDEISKDSFYTKIFNSIYEKGITENNIRNAIATYERTLVPFNSKFDRNISGLEKTLTTSEKNGFNLFMGKAACATCHYAPIFNGMVPPSFDETEYEILGVPEKGLTKNAIIDPDKGRYNLYGTKERKHAFKTPTVRNIEMTSPYMHNGVYKTLEEVVDFYNRGGGAGIGIELENQTLPPEPLGLTNQEQKDLITFMKSLTDPKPEEKY